MVPSPDNGGGVCVWCRPPLKPLANKLWQRNKACGPESDDLLIEAIMMVAELKPELLKCHRAKDNGKWYPRYLEKSKFIRK